MTIVNAKANNKGEPNWACLLTALFFNFFLLHKFPLQQSKLSGLKCGKFAKFNLEIFLVFLNNWHVLLEIQPLTKYGPNLAVFVYFR